MKKMIIGLGLLLGGATMATYTFADSEGIMYKSPNCGCCLGHLEHLEQAGFKIDIEENDDLFKWKQSQGIGERASGCHTILMDGYVFEGHIPDRAIIKFLAEKPKGVMGITVPGMPTFSPGMAGQQGRKLPVYYINADGTIGDLYGDF